VALARQHYATDAIEALLVGRPVPMSQTRVHGCTTKWLSTSVAGVEDEMKAIQAKPVTLEPLSLEDLKGIKANASSRKTVVLGLWNLGDRNTAAQFAELQTTFRMYAGSNRPMDMITVSTDAPAKRDAVLAFLKSQYATSRNQQLALSEAETRPVLGPRWRAAQAFTVVVGPDGRVLYEKAGRIDIYELRRIVLASFPDEPAWPGIHDYYQATLARMAAKGR